MCLHELGIKRMIAICRHGAAQASTNPQPACASAASSVKRQSVIDHKSLNRVANFARFEYQISCDPRRFAINRGAAHDSARKLRGTVEGLARCVFAVAYRRDGRAGGNTLMRPSGRSQISWLLWNSGWFVFSITPNSMAPRRGLVGAGSRHPG
jgi:hypothetical protein